MCLRFRLFFIRRPKMANLSNIYYKIKNKVRKTLFLMFIIFFVINFLQRDLGVIEKEVVDLVYSIISLLFACYAYVVISVITVKYTVKAYLYFTVGIKTEIKISMALFLTMTCTVIAYFSYTGHEERIDTYLVLVSVVTIFSSVLAHYCTKLICK